MGRVGPHEIRLIFFQIHFFLFKFFCSISSILLKYSNKAYFWHNVFNKLNRTLFWRVAMNTFKVLCVYDMTLVFMTGFHDSIRIFYIAEIIGP